MYKIGCINVDTDRHEQRVLTWINGWVAQAFWYSRYTGAKALFCLAVMGHSPDPHEPASPGVGPWGGTAGGRRGGELHVGTAKKKSKKKSKLIPG